MSHYPQPSTVYATQPTNGLGLAGFIVSLVSLVMCGGVLSPIGLIMSFVALFRKPKGFAIAGFILGLIGSFWIIIAVVFIGLGTVFAALGGAEAMERAQRSAMEIKTYSMGDAIVLRVSEFEDKAGLLPPSLDMARLDFPNEDAWGNPYRYTLILDETQMPDYTLTSDGPDGIEDTEDDLVIYPHNLRTNGANGAGANGMQQSEDAAWDVEWHDDTDMDAADEGDGG